MYTNNLSNAFTENPLCSVCGGNCSAKREVNVSNANTRWGLNDNTLLYTVDFSHCQLSC